MLKEPGIHSNFKYLSNDSKRALFIGSNWSCISWFKAGWNAVMITIASHTLSHTVWYNQECTEVTTICNLLSAMSVPARVYPYTIFCIKIWRVNCAWWVGWKWVGAFGCFWKVMHRDLKCSNLLLDVSGRVTWLIILLASTTHNDTFSSHVAGPKLLPEFKARQPRWRYQILVAAWQRFFVLHSSGVSFAFRHVDVSQC